MGMTREELMRRYQSDAATTLGDPKKKKKKKKSKSSSSRHSGSKVSIRSNTGLRIIDEDDDLFPSMHNDSDGGGAIQTTFASVSKRNAGNHDDEADIPLVAEFIDEGAIKGTDLKLWKSVAADQSTAPVRTRHDSVSPSRPRRVRQHSPQQSPPRRRHDSPDQSPPRRRHDSPDQSPPRSTRHDSPDLSPPRKRHDSPDQSPPRRRQRHDSPDQSPPRRSHDSPDLSPPRRTSRKHSPSQSPTKRRHTSHSDSSPPRRRQRQDSSDSSPVRRHQSANDDLSPPRKRRDHSEDLSPPRRSENGIKDGGIGSKVMADGTKAGLVEASMVVEAGRRKKEKEDRDFAKLDEATMGRHAETVRRDKKTGKKIDPKLERLQQRDADNKREAAEHAALRWGKGAVQERTQQQKMEDDIKVMAQPFARTADDKDLNDMLKERHRAEDPMAHLVKKKTKKQLPVYKGAAPPPNRYNIWPGYRWDGVDRGNQFEKKLFTMQADASANAADYLAWATEDM